MNQNKENMARKIKLDQGKVMSLIKVLMVLVVLVLVLFAIAKIFRDHFHIGGNLSAVQPDDAISQALKGDRVLDMQALNSGIALLTDSELIFLGTTGSIDRISEHNFDSPAIAVKKSNVLLYDRGKTGYKIEKRTGTVFEGHADKSIICGTITSSSGYALATRAEDATSQLIVYNSNFKEKFRWTCASEHIVAIDLSNNNRQAAVAVLGSKDAVIYSKVHLFNFKYNDSISVYDFDGDSVFAVKHIANNTAMLCTPSGIHILSDGNNKIVKDLDSINPRYFDYSDNNRYALLGSKYGSMYANELYVINKKGEELFSLTVSENVRGLACTSSEVSLMLNDRIDSYNYKGECIGSVPLYADALDFDSISGRLYVLSSTGIRVHMADSFQKEIGSQAEHSSDAEEQSLID